VWYDDQYNSQNLNINITETLENNQQYINLKNMYQYVRIDGVSLKAIPQPVNGFYPPTAWAYLFGNDNMVIQYSAIPRLPGAKVYPSNKTTTHFFRRVGRQKDFGWYNDDIEQDSKFSIRVRFSEQPNDGKFIFMVKVFATFSMLIQYGTGGKESDEKLFKNVAANAGVNDSMVSFLTTKNEILKDEIGDKEEEINDMSNTINNLKQQIKNLEKQLNRRRVMQTNIKKYTPITTFDEFSPEYQMQMEIAKLNKSREIVPSDNPPKLIEQKQEKEDPPDKFDPSTEATKFVEAVSAEVAERLVEQQYIKEQPTLQKNQKILDQLHQQAQGKHKRHKK
jgi:predicted  nucleic acid-binding Zn-ribbon protein